MSISVTFIITIAALALLMFVWELIANRISYKTPQGKIIIYGAGKAGLVLAGRVIDKCNYKNWDFSKSEIVGFIDDNPKKEKKLTLHSSKETTLPVFGNYTMLDDLIRNKKVTATIVAIGNPDRPEHIDEVVKICRKHQITCYQFDFSLTKIS